MYTRLSRTMRFTYFGSSAVLLLFVGLIEANRSSFSTSSPRAGDGDVQINIVHTNNMHARFEQTSQLSGTCSSSEAEANSCYGGFARVATLVRNARAGSTPTLYLDAGDIYQGTVWFTVYKWQIAAKLLSILQPDAFCLGNHEFDDGVEGLTPFINNVTFPVLAANLNVTNEPELAATKLAKSTIVDVNGTQVGIIGYLTPDTRSSSSTGNVIFEDELEAISEEAKRLKENGVNIIIALGHSGFTVDKTIAAEIEDIDLVIGAHTHTFLYTGTQPDSETPVDSYPTAITQSSGKIVYVVQAYAYTKYLGNLSVTFDSEGELTHIEGSPILLDSSIEQAADVLAELKNWRDEITNLTNTIVGSTRVLLNGDSQYCGRVECNMGNLITDALVDYNGKLYTGSDGWTDAAIAVINAGYIRTSVTTDNDNQITKADILTVLPFSSSVVTVSMTGKEMLSMLEWSAYYLTGNEMDSADAFLQVSGIQVIYDLSKPSNSKVVSVQVRCANCRVPVFRNLNETATYSVIMNEFISSGGDGFSMLSGLESKTLNTTLADIVIDYLGRRSPVYPAIEWRITSSDTTDADTDTETDNGASYITQSLTMIILPLLMGVLT